MATGGTGPEFAQQTFSYLVILPAALGVLGGFLGNYALSVIQNSRGHWNKRSEQICAALERAADLGVEYWTAQRTSDAETKLIEAKIVGIQSRIDGLVAAFLPSCPVTERGRLLELQIQVRNALTGGSFQSNSEADAAKALDVQVCVNLFIVQLHITSDAANSPFKFFRFSSFYIRGFWGRACKVCYILWRRRPLPKAVRQAIYPD